ncbi:MAG: sulfite exporter TauE/SafE family protein [Candidatus Cellulosilyticum pullistercoris]|uniref:Probable membrane transporter protein n=1 Tax=Candidatus Cellulosilyticum pullistercoris TaxID=2838521 RepID=A0A9E2KD17_9FIRM|nr:sulfite exporter TauE/SafE family protein [Candidatus Cellulosilyticum pullistercoris]
MKLITLILFAMIVMSTYLIEGIIGFGGTLLALPLVSNVVGMKTAVDVLVIVILFASAWVSIRDRNYIDLKVLKWILLFMLPGLPVGMWLFAVLPEKPLKIALGIFMIFVGIKGLYTAFKFSKASSRPSKKDSLLAKWLMPLSLFLGGIIHGAFTCGGPFVVIYAKKHITHKTSFRATLCALWTLLNGIMLTMSFLRHDLSQEIILLSIWTLPFMVFAIWLANLLHHKLRAEIFTHIVNAALIGSGILMML